MRLRTLPGVGLLIAGSLAGCSSTTENSELTIFAAASLGNAFTELVEDFEAENPELDVRLSLGGSSTLREQILEGAPVDVFASASEEIVDQLAEAGATIGEPSVFARNTMVVAFPRDQGDQGVNSLEGLAREQLAVGLCAAQVPCGRYADELLADADVAPSVDTREPDVRALLAKLVEGELDLGIVYASDLVGTDALSGWEPSPNAEVVYPLVVLSDRPEALAFREFVLSPEGQAVLAAHGFLPA